MSNALTEGFTSQAGFLDFLTPASPAAGANLSFTVGSLNVGYLEVVSVNATLTTDANVANRLFALDYLHAGTLTAIRNAATVLVTASTTNQVFQWDTAHALSEWNTGTPVFSPLVQVPLGPGWSVQLTVDNKQAGDQISAVTVVVKKFYPDTPAPDSD